MNGAVAVIFATIVRVVDGDTIQVNVNDCNQAVLCTHIDVRLEGFDTPELHLPKCAKEKDLAQKAKAITEAAFPVGTTLTLANPHRDKYFRLLAEQPLIAKKLIGAGLAVPYHGEKKTKDWCLSESQDFFGNRHEFYA